MITLYTPKLTEFATKRSTSVARIPSKRFGFTKKLLDKLPSPTNAQRAYFYDSMTRGLALAVSPAGKKVFVLYRKVDGRPERITIGPYPDLTIEQARNRAAELNGIIARGENPAARRRTVRDEDTLSQLFKTYLEQHAKPHKKSWRDDEELFNLHLNAWKLRKISEIRRMDVVNLHARIGARAPYTANRLVGLLRSMFNKSISWGWKGENPATKIRAFKEHKRERFLQPQEFPDFIRALGAEPNETFRDFFFLCLFTGARRANVQALRWSEINFNTATWTIPEETSKSGESVAVALSIPAMRILENRKVSIRSEWVFPGPGKLGHLVEPKTAWKRILTRAGIKDLRIHDLRRTLGSWQAATGASLPIIGKSLGHKSLGATQVYARLNLDPVRLSVEKATDAMMLAATGPVRLLANE
jgi:integrase